MALIHERMPAVAASIGAVAKTRQNQAQNYSFRGIDDFLNAVHSALVDQEVAILPEVRDHRVEFHPRANGGLTTHVFITMRYTFTAPDGSSVSVVTVGEAADVADKATNKAMSAALKYAIMQTFTVPTADIADSDRDSPEMGEVILISGNEQDALTEMFDPIEDEQTRRQAKMEWLRAFRINSPAQLPAVRLGEAEKWISDRVEEALLVEGGDGGY